MKSLVSVCLFVAALQLAVQPVYAVSPEKREVIVRLTEAMGLADLTVQMADGFMKGFHANMRKQNPEVSEKAITIVSEEILAAFTEGTPALMEIYVEIYDRHYTLDEIRELERFYATPVGQKSIQLLPVITQEGMEAGQAWALAMIPEVMPRIEQRLRREGLQ
eukprot:s1_g637.t1